jgi:hypothetical protein
MRKTIFAVTLSLGLALAACNQADRSNVANATENAGETLENAAGDFGDTLANTAAATGDVLENAAQKAEQGAENVSRAISNEVH